MRKRPQRSKVKEPEPYHATVRPWHPNYMSADTVEDGPKGRLEVEGLNRGLG